MQRKFNTIKTVVDTVGIQRSSDNGIPLLEFLSKVAAHQTQPVAIDNCFVLGIYCRNRIFAILNSSNRRLNENILNTGFLVPANVILSIDLNFDMQGVVL